MLRARCLLRLGDLPGAIRSLRSSDVPVTDSAQAAEYQVLLATSLVRAGCLREAEEAYSAAHRAVPLQGVLRLELGLYRALDAWTARDLDRAAGIIAMTLAIVPTEEKAASRPFDVVRAQVLELKSLVAASREQYTTQAALLVDAWNTLRQPPAAERDMWVGASLLRNLAPLAWDLQLDDETEFLRHAVSTVSWTDEIMSARYVAHRVLGWTAALQGDHVGAFARFRDCIDLAPTAPSRISSMLDRAYLASETRQTIIAQEEMIRAGELARTVAWEAVVGEDAKVLLELAEAYARDDAALARHWFGRYDRGRSLPPNLMLLASSDRRQTAMEEDAEAAVLAAEGFIQEAVARRRTALTTWDALGHGWRAARTAVAIGELTGSAHDAAVARVKTRAFQRSWLARRARSASRACTAKKKLSS
ncbi:MAG: hypothetical protein QOJ39_2063 [Candidatus Eremiobacteraeota bacterium]|jgi:tetratricopeptide (TPR) repeat protein|nr:hypothetical protein [Candidatus Eremiobacteraeota bacterium]